MKVPLPSRDCVVVTGQLALLFLIGLGLFLGFWALMVPDPAEISDR
jgi:hypothetical protein